MTRRNLLPILCASAALASAAVRGDDVLYVGGSINGIPEKTEGKLNLEGKGAVFTSKKGEFSIPFQAVTSLEYGQKAGRRVGVAIAISPIALLSKKRKHFLSIGYADAAGAKQGVVFEIGKGKTHSVISAFETKSGKKVEFESEEAKKQYQKGDH